jgi:Fe-S cluster assembly iron-binding protein IscA
MNLNLNAKNILNINDLNNLFLRIGISQGNIGLSNSKVMWNDDIEISLKESYLNYDKEDIKLVGRARVDFKRFNNFYSSFQIKKKNRKEIEKFEIDFVYNITQKKINFDNPLIDNKSSKKVDKFIQEFNFENKKFMNKIIIKNFVNNLFTAYAG